MVVLSWIDSMAGLAKDINFIYSSFNVLQHDYIETTENVSYVRAKNKWLIFQSKRGSNIKEFALKDNGIYES